MGTKNTKFTTFVAAGFTLVELLITLTLVAILAVAALLYLRGQAFKGNDARRKTDIARIKVAVEEYEKDHDCYPQYVVCGISQSQPIYPYLNNVPCDPTTNASYFYDYQDSSCPGWYHLFADLEFSEDPDATYGIGPAGAFNYVSSSANAPTPQSVGGGTNNPGGSGEQIPTSQYYGCRLGACIPIQWNENRPGPECDPSFQNSNCYGQCGPASVECVNVP